MKNMTISEFAEQVLGIQLYSFQKKLLETMYEKYKEDGHIPVMISRSNGKTGRLLGYGSVIIFYDEFIGEDSNVRSNSRRGTVD